MPMMELIEHAGPWWSVEKAEFTDLLEGGVVWGGRARGAENGTVVTA